MNCNDDKLNAKLYSNRATAHLKSGKPILLRFKEAMVKVYLVWKAFAITVSQMCAFRGKKCISFKEIAIKLAQNAAFALDL